MGCVVGLLVDVGVGDCRAGIGRQQGHQDQQCGTGPWGVRQCLAGRQAGRVWIAARGVRLGVLTGLGCMVGGGVVAVGCTECALPLLGANAAGR